MKAPTRPASRFEGTIMIFALVVILAGSLVLAGWVQMLATATVYPDTTAENVKNRIAIENARAMARQFLLNSLPSGSSADSGLMGLGNGWGLFRITNNSGQFWTNTNSLVGNPFSPFGNRCFAVTKGALFTCNDYNVEWEFLIKSRSPIVAGYPLVVHRTDTNPPNSLTPTNRRIFSNNIYFNTNSALEIAKFPQIPFTSSTNSPGYTGSLSAPLSTNYPPTYVVVTNQARFPSNTFTTNQLISSAGTNYNGGTVSVILDAADTTSSYLRYDVPNRTPANIFFTTNISGTNRRYTNVAITNLSIVGYTATNSLHIIIPANPAMGTNTNLAAITLTNTANTRKIYLSKQSTGNLTLRTATTNANYIWWFAATILPTNVTLSVIPPTQSGRSLRITGGFRSAGRITNSGTLTLTPETIFTGVDMDAVEFIADRVLWIEDGRSPSP